MAAGYSPLFRMTRLRVALLRVWLIPVRPIRVWLLAGALLLPWGGLPALALAADGAPTASAATPPPGAGLQIDIDVGQAIHQAIGAENLRARLSWIGRQPRFELRADSLTLPTLPVSPRDSAAPFGRIENLQLSCPRVEVTNRRIACAEARLSARFPQAALGLEAVPLAFDWDRQAGQVRFSLPWPEWFGGRGRLEGLVRAHGVRLDFELGDLDLQRLDRSGLLPAATLPVAVTAGRLAAAGWLETTGAAPAGNAEVRITGLGFSDAPGLRAGEALGLAGQLRQDPTGIAVQLEFTDGLLFVDPWFLDLAETGPLEVSVSELQPAVLRAEPSDSGPIAPAHWQARAADARIGTHASVRAEDLRFSTAGLEQGDIAWEASRLDTAGQWLVQPVLAGTVLGRTRFQGEAEGRLRLVGDRLVAVSARWRDLTLLDELQRFALTGARGHLGWQADRIGPVSFLTAGGGHVLGMPVAPFDSRFQLDPDGVRLVQPLHLGVLDGGLNVDVLSVHLRPEGPQIEFEGGVQAVSLEPLTAVFGWPAFAGTLSGIIPRVRYDVQGLRVDGRLLVRLFDGEVVIRDLRIRDLFGVAPTLALSAEIRRLELEQVTRAFDFGRVEGRVSGRLDELLLVDWLPERMDLVLMTDPEAPGRRRISQRAVENLTALGGGLQGAASLIFLRFFEDFTYRRLGFACVLEGQVCQLSGVADAPDEAFVLVEGGGLPRITVIGHNRRVDWPELVQRLQAVREGDPPVVQ